MGLCRSGPVKPAQGESLAQRRGELGADLIIRESDAQGDRLRNLLRINRK